MADFCKECSIREFGKDYGDLAGLVEPGCVQWVLCEGCQDRVRGFMVLVDHTGTRRRDLEKAWEESQISDER